MEDPAQTKDDPSDSEPDAEPKRIRFSRMITLVRRGKQGTYHADFHRNGKHTRVSLKTSNRRQAEQQARRLEQELLAGTFQTVAQSLKFSEATECFLNKKREKGLTAQTIQKYKHDLESFAKFAAERGYKSIHRLTFRLLDEYLTHLRSEGYAPTYVYKICMNLLSWLKWLKRQKHIALNPLEGYELIKPQPRRHPAATIEQINALLAHLSALELIVIAAAAFTGMRVGEIAALRPQDVDLDNAVITIRSDNGWRPKTEAGERQVPIHSRLLALLKAYRRAHPLRTDQSTYFVAPPSTRYPNGNHPIDRTWVNRVLKRTAAALGYVVGRANLGLTTHSLRRSFKSIAIDTGIPESLIDVWVGHKGSRDINAHYYRAQKSAEWISQMPFGKPRKDEINRIKGAIK